MSKLSAVLIAVGVVSCSSSSEPKPSAAPTKSPRESAPRESTPEPAGDHLYTDGPGKAPRKLAVTSLEPANGDKDGGTYVVIKGSSFIADGPRNVKVYFGSRQGTIVRFASDRELIVQAPGGKVGETVDVLVIFEPGGQQKLVKAFTFVDKQPPSVDKLQP